MKKEVSNKQNSERGGAGVKLLLVLLVIILIANAGYNYLPVMYQGESIKQEIDGAIVKATVLPIYGKTPVDAVKTRIIQAARNNDIPENALIEVKQTGQTVTGRVRYAKYVELLPFGLYRYTYNFDYSSAPTGFVTKNS